MKDLKTLVQEKYGQIARQSEPSSCCGGGGEAGTEKIIYSVMADDYTHLEGYEKEADLGLGCGLPTQFARIREGDTVVDLGSGAGNDCFVARAETGEAGRVIGVDFTGDMIVKARRNAEKQGFGNVGFVYGDIEAIPLPDAMADVVVSNCVFNLVPDKEKAFAETFRILKPGGHFSISDIVVEGTLPAGLQKDAELYAGCVAGAIQQEAYLSIIGRAGFTNLHLQKKKSIVLPAELLERYLNAEEIGRFNRDFGIYSITVYAEKPV